MHVFMFLFFARTTYRSYNVRVKAKYVFALIHINLWFCLQSSRRRLPSCFLSSRRFCTWAFAVLLTRPESRYIFSTHIIRTYTTNTLKNQCVCVYVKRRVFVFWSFHLIHDITHVRRITEWWNLFPTFWGFVRILGLETFSAIIKFNVFEHDSLLICTVQQIACDLKQPVKSIRVCSTSGLNELTSLEVPDV